MSKSTIKISDIVVDFFVRAAADPDRIQWFHDRRQAGEELEPVDVDAETKQLLDGRHRMGGATKFGDINIPVNFHHFKTQEERVAFALAANSGGAMPPSNTDIHHVIEYLYSIKTGRKRITELVSKAVGVNESFVRHSISRVLSRLRTIQVRKAVDAVVDDDLKTNDAATAFGVDPAEIKAELSHRRTKGAARNDIGLKITNVLKGSSRSVGSHLKHVQTLVSDGEMTLGEAKAIVQSLEKQLKNMIRANKDWLARFTQAEAAPKAAQRLFKQRSKSSRYLAKKKAYASGGNAKSALSAMGL